MNVEDYYITRSNFNPEFKENRTIMFAKDYDRNQIQKLKSYIEYRDKQKKEYLGGKFMYDITGYYKRLDDTELFDYWLKNIHKC